MAEDRYRASSLFKLLQAIVSEKSASKLFAQLQIDAALLAEGARLSRAQLAMALNMLLFGDLLARVPTGAAYVQGVVAAGGRICFDHGALRTIDGETGALPSGIAAIARLLEPLGYHEVGLYPLPRLKMTGHVFAHRDFPETIPQFFISELHIDQFPEGFSSVAARVFGASANPFGKTEMDALAELSRNGTLDFDQAAAILPRVVRAFGRHHPRFALADYEALLAHSAEAAWIATEGNAFNHATDRVADVQALSARLLAQGNPLKPEVEISANGRVRQTAFKADMIERNFIDAAGGVVTRSVPGSFYEFISRDIDPATAALDLTFDTGNATGIFAVTAV